MLFISVVRQPELCESLLLLLSPFLPRRNVFILFSALFFPSSHLQFPCYYIYDVSCSCFGIPCNGRARMCILARAFFPSAMASRITRSSPSTKVSRRQTHTQNAKCRKNINTNINSEDVACAGTTGHSATAAFGRISPDS